MFRRVAGKRSPANHMRLAGGWALRILERRLREVRIAEPVGGPLPDVPCHIEQSPRIGIELLYGRCIYILIIAAGLFEVGVVPAVLAVERVDLVRFSAAGSILPLGFGRQASSHPAAKGFRVF